MSLEKFGEFLVRMSKGKVTGNHIVQALMKQKKFADGYKKLGELLVEDKIITESELTYYLDLFEKSKNQS